MALDYALAALWLHFSFTLNKKSEETNRKKEFILDVPYVICGLNKFLWNAALKFVLLSKIKDVNKKNVKRTTVLGLITPSQIVTLSGRSILAGRSIF